MTKTNTRALKWVTGCLISLGVVATIFGLQLVLQQWYSDPFVGCESVADPGQSMTNGGVSTFPIGLMCDWIAPDGSAHSGIVKIWWVMNVAVYGGLLATIGGLVAARRSRRAPALIR